MAAENGENREELRTYRIEVDGNGQQFIYLSLELSNLKNDLIEIQTV